MFVSFPVDLANGRFGREYAGKALKSVMGLKGSFDKLPLHVVQGLPCFFGS